MTLIKHCVNGVYRNSNIIAKKGVGSWVYDIYGKKYLDMSSGIGALSTGHSHPRIVKAVSEQIPHLVHAQQNCILTHLPKEELIEKINLINPSHLNTHYFTNSGSEAVENAIKVARMATKKPNIISFIGGFHGRTIGCMSLSSSKISCKTGFSPLMSGVYNLRYPTEGKGEEIYEELENLFKRMSSPDETAAIIMEPILGEGGLVKADPYFVKKMRQLCDKHGILWISDEVQTGMGRTGHWWGYEMFGVEPDIITFGKGIASGFQLAGVSADKSLFDTIHENGLGGTYNGNVLAVTAANATLDIMHDEDLLVNVNTMSSRLQEKLTSLNHPLIIDTRCYGLMVAIQLDVNPERFRQIMSSAEHYGLILLSTGIDTTIRLLPPLNISDDELGIFIGKFNDLLNS